jgi:hypothetical protein
MTATVPATPTDQDHEGTYRVLPDDAIDAAASTPGPLDEIRSGLKIVANLGVTIGKSVDRMTSSVDRLMRRLQQNTPIDYGGAQSGTFPASGDLILSFGSPDAGTRWEVTNVVVGGTDLNITAVGTAGLYVSSFVPLPGQPNPAGTAGAADIAKSLPNVAFYGTRQLVVNDQEYLYLVVFGGSSGQIYVANFSATVFNVSAAGGRDTNIL